MDEKADYLFLGNEIGKTMKMTLNGSKDYLLEEIEPIVLKEYVNERNKVYFDNCTVTLGTQDGRLLTDCKNDNGGDSDFWKLTKEFKKSGHPVTLYLYTTYISKKSGIEKSNQNASTSKISDSDKSLNM